MKEIYFEKMSEIPSRWVSLNQVVMQFLTNDATSIKESISCENSYENKKLMMLEVYSENLTEKHYGK